MKENKQNIETKTTSATNKKNIIILVITFILLITLVSLITYKMTSNNFKLKEQTSKKIKNQEQKSSSKKHKEENSQDKKQETQTTKDQNPTISDTSKYKEDDVITYFEDLDTIVNTKDQSTQNTSKIKSSLEEIYDFLFNEKTIKGYKFKDLTTKTKLKVLTLALKIDYKIDNYFPDYKEKIKEKCKSLKQKAIKEYLELTANICENNEELCTSAKDDFATMKKSYKFGLSYLKDIITSSSSKVKKWWKDK